MEPTGEKLAYRIDEASRASGIGRTKLYEQMKAGRLQACKVGNRTLILRSELQRFLQSLEAA
jgi:excisionase family DNA binding protein